MKRLFSTLGLVATVALCASAMAQNPGYILQSTSASGDQGASVSSGIEIDIDSAQGGQAIAGWSYGVCHDSAVATLTNAVLGTTALTVNNGNDPDFFQINVFTSGYTIGAVISFLGSATLAPGFDYELTVADYTLSGNPGDTSALALCDTLGSPPVSTVVVVSGQSVFPTLDEGTLTINMGSVDGFVYSIADQTVDFPSSTGLASFTSSFNLVDTGASGIVTQGFSIGIGHDGALVEATGLTAAGVLAALNGGSGPDFFGPATLADGVTLGCVYSFLGSATLTFDTAEDIVDVAYNTVPTDLMGDTTPTVTTLEFLSTLGSPPVDNVVVVGGQSVDPIGFDGAEITLNPTMGPALAVFVVGDTNQDGKKNVADPVYILNFLTSGGPALDCPASGDADNDGMLMVNDAVILLEHYFIGGAAPQGPFPDCGTRPGVETTDCTFDQGVCP